MLGILSSYEFLNYWSIWRLEFKGLGVNIYTVDISFSEMLIPRDILIPFEFECGKFDSRPGAGLVWAHARVADQWMDGAWTRGMPGMMVRWEDGGVGTHGVRTGPRPRPNNTRGSQSPLSWHTVNISRLVTVTPSLYDSNDCIALWVTLTWVCCDIIEECWGHFSEEQSLDEWKKSSYFINIQMQDVIEIQDKSLFKVQKASQVEKFTIVVGWRSISSEGRRRLLSTRSWFIPGNLSQPSFKALCGVNFSSAFNQNPLRRGVYEWCSEVYNWFCWMMKWNIWNQSSWVSGIGCQTILYCKIVSIRPRLACFICNQFEQ